MHQQLFVAVGAIFFHRPLVYSTVVPKPTFLLSCISLSQRSGQVLSGLRTRLVRITLTCSQSDRCFLRMSISTSSVVSRVDWKSLRLKFANEPSIFVDGDLDHESMKRSASDRLGDLVPQVRARTSPGGFRDTALLGLCLDLSFSVLYCRTQANLPTQERKVY